MNMKLLPLLFVGGMLSTASFGYSQEVLPEIPEEKIPYPKEMTPAPSIPLVLSPSCKEPCESTKILVGQHQIPVQVLEAREVTRVIKRPSHAIAYRKEKRIITDMVLKPHEVVKHVPCTTMELCTVTCPETGECKTIMKPVTRMVARKDTVYYSVPDQRVVEVDVPYLKPVIEEVPQRDILLEYKTHMETREFVVPVPGLVLPDRHIIAPRGCPTPLPAGMVGEGDDQEDGKEKEVK